jgi:hypothetical protein
MGSADKDRNVMGFLTVMMNIRICNSREKPGVAKYDPRLKNNPSKNRTLPVKVLKIYKAAKKCVKFHCSVRCLKLY